MSKNVTRRRVLRTVVSGAAATGIAGKVTAEESGRRIVGLAPNADFEVARGRASNVDRELDFAEFGKAVAGRFPEAAVEALERNPNVEYVERDSAVYAHDQIVPWGIDRVDADVVHGNPENGTGANVAIVDTGIDDEHPDLQPNLGQGYAVETCSGWGCNYDWSDDRGHGTHCAGTAAAADTDDGVIGVAPEVTLHSVKVLDDTGGGTWSGVADGIQWVADQGYDVASLSLGGSSGSNTLHNAVQYAHDRGVLLVSSAGNDGPCSDCVGYPAAYDEVIAVSATDSSDSLASFSSTGPEVELAAPGVNVYSTEIGGYDTKSGTSMAAPHVSGVGGQLMANGYTHTQARQRLRDTAEDIGLGVNEQGYGLVDAAEAVLDGGGEVPEAPVIEDFDRSNPLAEYGGRTDLFSTTSSPVYEGSQALVNDGGDFGSVVSTSGLDEYPSRGDEVHVYFDNAWDDNFLAFHIFAQSETDNPDGYTVGISAQGAWRMWRNEGGSLTQIADGDLPSSDQISGWYRAEIRTDSTTVYADLYDDSTDGLLASIQADDTTYSSGGIGFRSTGNGEVFDYVVLDDDPDDNVVEDFERSNPLSEYGGSTGLFDTTSSPVYEGSQALVNDGGSFGGVNSTSGLDTYPERGDDVTVYFNNASGDNFVAFNLFSQAEVDNPDRYSIGLSGVSGDLTLWKTEGGSIDTLDSSPPSSTTAGWYRVEISTDSSTVSADLYDDSSDTHLASVSASDSTFSSGGIGFRSAGNGEVFDYVIIDE